MLEPTAETCEVKSHGVWIAVSLEAAAIVYGRDVHRCPSCHGRVVILGGARGSNTTRAKYHSQPHDGCPLMPEAFSGRATLHPQALT